MSDFKSFSSNIKNLQTDKEVFVEDIKDAEKKVTNFLIERYDNFFAKKIPKTIDGMVSLVREYLKPYGVQFTPKISDCKFEITLNILDRDYNSYLMNNPGKDDIPQCKITYKYILNGIFTSTHKFKKTFRFLWSNVAQDNTPEIIEFLKRNSSNIELLNKIKKIELDEYISRSNFVYKVLNLPFEQNMSSSRVHLYKVRDSHLNSNELFVGSATFNLFESFSDINKSDDTDFFKFISANIVKKIVDKKLKRKVLNFKKDILPSLKLSDIKYCIKNSEVDNIKEQIEELQSKLHSLQNDLLIMEDKYKELYLLNNPFKSCEIPIFNSENDISNILDTSVYKHIDLKFGP